jgi:membrane protein implicated in regulation of membrane protease activity
MDLSGATGWWIVAGVLVAAELASGTFYLLMLALGAVAAALAAHLGAAFGAQLLAAAIVGGGAVAAWHVKRSRQPAAAPASKNPDVNLDIGSTLQVDEWNADGTAQVSYRGANWTVSYAGRGAPHSGAHVIRAVEGSRLMVERSPHPH